MTQSSAMVDTIDHDAEAAILAAVITDPESLVEIDDRLRPHDFGVPAHAAIYEACLKCEANGRACDRVTVAEQLYKDGHLGQTVPTDLLPQLLSYMTDSVNLMTCVEIVKDRSLKRKVLQASRSMASSATKPELSGTEAVTDAERTVFKLGDSTDGGVDVVSLKDSLEQTLEELRNLDEDELVGVTTGFTALDDATQGFKPGQVIIVAARPGMGKTSIALQMAAKMAESTNERVLLLSHEMTHQELSARLLSMYMGKSLRDLQSGRLLADEEEEVLEVVEKVSELPIDLVDQPPTTLSGMRSLVRRQGRRGQVAGVVLDYVQMMHGESKRDSTRSDDLGQIIYGAKADAKELQVPFIVLSQLNRGVEGRIDKRPTLSDLRESGSLEQAADVVLMLYRPGASDPNADPTEAELIVGKQRNGQAPLTIPLRWNGPCTRYENLPGVTTAQTYTAPPKSSGFGGGGFGY